MSFYITIFYTVTTYVTLHKPQLHEICIYLLIIYLRAKYHFSLILLGTKAKSLSVNFVEAKHEEYS